MAELLTSQHEQRENNLFFPQVASQPPISVRIPYLVPGHLNIAFLPFIS